MENGTETNYFATTEPQDSGTEFLLPSLLCWKIITFVRVHMKLSPHRAWGNPRSILHRFKPLIKKPKKPHKIIGHVTTLSLCSKLAVTSIVCLSTALFRGPHKTHSHFSLLREWCTKESQDTYEYTCPRPALQHTTVTAPALGSDLPLRPLPCPLFLSSQSPAFSHLTFSSNWITAP